MDAAAFRPLRPAGPLVLGEDPGVLALKDRLGAVARVQRTTLAGTELFCYGRSAHIKWS